MWILFSVMFLHIPKVLCERYIYQYINKLNFSSFTFVIVFWSTAPPLDGLENSYDVMTCWLVTYLFTVADLEGRNKRPPPPPPIWSTIRAFTLVLGTVPAGTCSRNMFSVHTISSSMNDVLKRIVPARTVPAGTWSNHVLGTKTPR